MPYARRPRLPAAAVSLSAAMTRIVASTVAPAPWRAPVELDEAAEELEVPEPVSEEEAVFELEPEPDEVPAFEPESELEPELEDVEPAELDDPAAEDEVLAWLDNVVAAVAEVVVATADVVRDAAVLELDELLTALAPPPAAADEVTELVSVLVTVAIALLEVEVEVEDVDMTVAVVTLVTEMLSMYTWAVPAVHATLTLRTPLALEAVPVPLNFFQSLPMIKTTGK